MRKFLYFFTLIIMTLMFAACQQKQQQLQGYVEGYFTYLSVNTDGYLQQRQVERGNQVQAKQPLFVLEAQPQEAQLIQAQQKLKEAEFNLSNLQKGQRATVLESIEAQLKQAQAELDLAQKTFTRNQQLISTHTISKQQFDQAKADFQTSQQKLRQQIANLQEAKLGARTDVVQAAEATVAEAAAEANQAQWYLAKKTVSAPAAGIIFDTYYNNGEFVQAGHPVLSMLIPGNVRLIFYVPEPLLSKIKLGQTVSVHCDGCDKAVSAQIVFISSEAEFTPPIIFSDTERKKFVYRVEAKFNDEDAKLMHPGQPVDVLLTR
jgi:HlyD family secretion protein